MTQLPDLENISIPLYERYIKFIEWVTQQNFLNSDYLANKLDVKTGVVDMFFQLEGFEDDEFEIIDKNQIDVDMLYLIAHHKPIIRRKIYPEIATFKSVPQPITAIQSFVDNEIIGSYEDLLQKISPEYWYSIHNYLNGRDINEGAITKPFRGLTLTVAKTKKKKQLISRAQMNWLSQGIAYDGEMELGVFLNDEVKSKFTSDCKKIVAVVELINGLVS